MTEPLVMMQLSYLRIQRIVTYCVCTTSKYIHVYIFIFIACCHVVAMCYILNITSYKAVYNFSNTVTMVIVLPQFWNSCFIGWKIPRPVYESSIVLWSNSALQKNSLVTQNTITLETSMICLTSFTLLFPPIKLVKHFPKSCISI